MLGETADCIVQDLATSDIAASSRASKLVVAKKVGLEQHYSLTATPLREVDGWVAQYCTLFDPSGHAWNIMPVDEQEPKHRVNKGTTDGR